MYCQKELLEVYTRWDLDGNGALEASELVDRGAASLTPLPRSIHIRAGFVVSPTAAPMNFEDFLINIDRIRAVLELPSAEEVMTSTGATPNRLDASSTSH